MFQPQIVVTLPEFVDWTSPLTWILAIVLIVHGLAWLVFPYVVMHGIWKILDFMRQFDGQTQSQTSESVQIPEASLNAVSQPGDAALTKDDKKFLTILIVVVAVIVLIVMLANY